jgi:hypothetical protein
MKIPKVKRPSMECSKAIETWFIPADSLSGMALLYSIGSALNFDLKKDVVKLTK